MSTESEKMRRMEERIAALERGARGPQRFAKSGVGGATKYAKMKSGGLRHEYLKCQFYDPITGALGADVDVAKPYWFRLSTYYVPEGDPPEPINSINYEHIQLDASGYQSRRAIYQSNGQLAEMQQITPTYFGGCVIVIEKVNGGVRLREDVLSEDDPPVMVTCQYIDRNDEPRAWCA